MSYSQTHSATHSRKWPPGIRIPTFQSNREWTSNFHTHSHYCDGKKSPKKYARYAREFGLTDLGFSGHAPVPYPPGADSIGVGWCTSLDSLFHYLEIINGIKDSSGDGLTIHSGLEIDYIPHLMGPHHPMFKILNLDFVIGSVHVAGQRSNEKMWTVDCAPEKFKAGLDTIFGGSVEKLVGEYYRRIREMVSLQPPDIIGHIDIIKKNNKALNFLDETAAYYRDAVFETLEAVADSNCIVEVNTGGMARGYTDEPYPSQFIMDQCRTLEIPMMINSDAHHPKKLTAHFDLARDMLVSAGY